MEAGKSILLVAQKSAAKDEPVAEDLYKIGCISNILQMLKLPDGTVKVLVEGSRRARIQRIDDARSHYVAEALAVPADAGEVTEIEAMRRALIAQFDQYVKLNKKIPPEILTSLAGIEEAGRLADTIAAHLPLKLEQKQQVLEMFEVKPRLEHLLSQLETEIDILQVEKRIRGRVKRQMEKSQREYYLNEQVKAIQKELGEGEDGADLEEIEKRIKASSTPTTTVWRRSRSASSNISRCKPAWTRSRRRSCAWWARPAWERPRSGSRSPARPTASSCACRWAGCATRPRSAATAAPISARCPARSCRT